MLQKLSFCFVDLSLRNIIDLKEYSADSTFHRRLVSLQAWFLGVWISQLITGTAGQCGAFITLGKGSDLKLLCMCFSIFRLSMDD